MLANFPAVPDVDSSALRLAVPAEVVVAAAEAAERMQLMRDELLELVLRSRLDPPTSPAAALWDRYCAGEARTAYQVAAELAAHGVLSGVRGLRLGSPAPDRVEVPWPRPGLGADLSWTPVQAWPAVRGVWRMTTIGVDVIAALRLGHVLGVYRVSEWAEHEPTGRKYAVAGHAITADGRLLDVDTGADAGAASPIDVQIYSVLTATPIVTAGRQTVVKLSAR